MRNLKKFLAMALTVLMVVGSFGMVATANFDDVDEYQEAVNVMTDLGIACGYEDGTFGEDDFVQRQQIALWIAKMMTGKVDTTYVTNNFVGGVNYTAFVDVEDAEDLDVYTGAINYAANNGIIVGTSATTFEPVENVLLQDVFAMAVRMLGYGSTAMNNNYPYSFIDKAISLGLDAGLGNEYIVDANATRGQTMQVLYNALTVAKSDGSTLGYDYFNVEKATVVITGTKSLNAFTKAQLITATEGDEDYVAFSILNADGTVSGDACYYALRSEFGFDAETDVNLLLGYSYNVLTNDGFQTFITCDVNDYEVVDQTSVKGGDKDHRKDVTLNDVAFKLVDAYSDYAFGSTKANNNKEVILYTVGTKAPSYYASSYVYNDELDIMDSRDTSKVLLHWFKTFGAEGYVLNGGVYLFMIPGTEANPQYIEPNDYIWSLAAKNTYGPSENASEGYVAMADSYDKITTKNAYSETVLFDDNNDGTPDRGIYVPYYFAQVGVKDEYFTMLGAKKADGAAKAAASTIYVDGEKSTLDAVNGKYVKYFYNTVIDTLFVKTIYETQSALITGIDWANGMVYFNGFGVNPFEGAVPATSMTLGVSNYVGADKASVAASKIGNFQELVGKKVNYILDGENVVRILNAADDAGYMVVVKDSGIGYTTMGYKNILAYYDAAANKAASTQTVVTLNAVNSYWYSGYGSFINNNLTNQEFDFEMGDLLKATKDALGNYDVQSVDYEDYTYLAYYEDEEGDWHYAFDDNGECICEFDEDYEGKANHVSVISVINGIVSGNGDFKPFKAQADTVWVIYDTNARPGYEFKSMTGVPNNIKITGVAAANVVNTDDFIYIVLGEDGNLDGLWTPNNEYLNQWDNNTTVYVDANTAVSPINNPQLNGFGVNFQPYFTYNTLVDIENAKLIASNNGTTALKAGNFYNVVNGYVAGEARDTSVKVALLLEADNDTTWSYEYVELGTIADVEAKYTSVAKILNDGKITVPAVAEKTENAFAHLMWVDANGNANTANALAKGTDAAKAIAASMTDDTTGEKALVVYYKGNLSEFNKAPIFLAASPATVYVTLNALADVDVDATNASGYEFYKGTTLADITAKNYLGNSADAITEAGNYIVTYTVPTDTETIDYTDNGVTGYYDNCVPEYIWESTTKTAADLYKIEFTKLDAHTDYTATKIAYKFTLDAAKVCNCDDCEENYLDVEIKIDVTKKDIEPDPEDEAAKYKDAKVNFAVVKDASVTDTTSRNEIVTEIAVENFWVAKDYTAKVAPALVSGATSLDDITVKNVSGRNVRIKVADNYNVAISYIKDADLVDTTIPFTSATENVQGQFNYYYFTLTQDMIDTADGEININIELTEKN